MLCTRCPSGLRRGLDLRTFSLLLVSLLVVAGTAETARRPPRFVHFRSSAARGMSAAFHGEAFAAAGPCRLLGGFSNRFRVPRSSVSFLTAFGCSWEFDDILGQPHRKMRTQAVDVSLSLFLSTPMSPNPAFPKLPFPLSIITSIHTKKTPLLTSPPPSSPAHPHSAPAQTPNSSSHPAPSIPSPYDSSSSSCSARDTRASSLRVRNEGSAGTLS